MLVCIVPEALPQEPMLQAMRLNFYKTSAVIFAVTVGQACADARSESSQVTDAEPIEWAVDSVPLLSIGTLDGEAPYIFSRIVGLDAWSDGYIVADAQAKEIRVFDGAGTHLDTFGGAGEGPGEFVLLSSMYVLPGDTVLAWDLRARRLTVFGPEMQLVDTESMALSTAYFASTAFGTGELLIRPFGAVVDPPPPGSTVRPTSYFVTYRRGGESPLDTILELPARPVYVSDDDEYPRLPFTVGPLVASGDSTVWAGTGETGWIVQIHPQGEVLARLELPEGAPIPPSRIAEEEEATGAPSPDRYPAFDRLLVDDQGRVWTRDYLDEDDAEQSWSVRRPDGEDVGRVAFAPPFRPVVVRGGRVVGVWRDDLGVESVRVYAFREP